VRPHQIVRQLVPFAAAALVCSLAIAPAFGADDASGAWKALAEGGHVALIRHGNAPGPSLGAGGDPPGFRIGDCRTQRNLDETGRGEAKALGEAFRSHGVRVDRIQSSPWCRCMETAQLMALGPVEVSSALIPSTDRNPNAPAALRTWPVRFADNLGMVRQEKVRDAEGESPSRQDMET
jgi:hypothetical protein